MPVYVTESLEGVISATSAFEFGFDADDISFPCSTDPEQQDLAYTD